MDETPAGFTAFALTFFDTDETVTMKTPANASVVPPPAARP
jgi:hypothetical protein